MDNSPLRVCLTCREISLRSEEERGSRLREELLTVREELNKAHLAREVLEQHKDDSESVIAQMEKAKTDVELELERVLMERADLQVTLVTGCTPICGSETRRVAARLLGQFVQHGLCVHRRRSSRRKA